MKTLIIIGNDKIGRLVAKELDRSLEYMVVFDNSTSIWRIVKILKQGALGWSDLLKMFLANLFRRNVSIDGMDFVYTNAEIEEIIKREKINRVLLFRAGIIIDKKLLNIPRVDFLNIHCAKIPEFGGLGSISKALKDKTYDQVATLHRVVEQIDSGEILKTVPYKLSGYKSFRENEDEAYMAGKKLLLSFLSDEKRVC